MRGLPLIISITSTLAAKRNFVVLQGCGDDESKACHDSFWEDIRQGLEAELPNLDPADVRCVDSDASERAALADVAASASSGASTHVVAANMTAAQTKKMKARKRGFAKPAVYPQWVVDSAARRCKLDPGPYLLWRASGPTDEALAVVRARNNLRKAGFGSEVVEEVVDDASSASSAATRSAYSTARGSTTSSETSHETMSVRL